MNSLTQFQFHKSTEYPQICIHNLLEFPGEKTPSNIAVTCEKQHLTYQELNERSNQLAHYLKSLGVGAEVMVGICLERTINTVAELRYDYSTGRSLTKKIISIIWIRC